MVRLKNKRGEITDIITIVFWLFFFGVVLILLTFVFAVKLFPALQSSLTPLTQVSEVNETINNAITYTSVGLPSTMLVIFFGLLLGMMITSFFVRSHPVFIPLYILFGLGTVIVSVALGNTWSSLMAYSEFQDTVNLNTVTQIIGFMMNNIVKIAVISFFMSIVILFAKPSPQGGEPI